MLAGRLLEVELPQQRKVIFAFMETDGCAVDGVSVTTGCSVGRRTMRILDFGKVAATFVDTDTGEALRIAPRPEVRQAALKYAPGAPNRWTAMLEGYQVMPSHELLVAVPVRLTVDLEAIISRPGVRVHCERCGEEIINEREVHRNGTVLCRHCDGDIYYRSHGQRHPLWSLDDLQLLTTF
jgi:formylmethanofuran dehydrogenase subunit E